MSADQPTPLHKPTIRLVTEDEMNAAPAETSQSDPAAEGEPAVKSSVHDGAADASAKGQAARSGGSVGTSAVDDEAASAASADGAAAGARPVDGASGGAASADGATAGARSVDDAGARAASADGASAGAKAKAAAADGAPAGAKAKAAAADGASAGASAVDREAASAASADGASSIGGASAGAAAADGATAAARPVDDATSAASVDGATAAARPVDDATSAGSGASGDGAPSEVSAASLAADDGDRAAANKPSALATADERRLAPRGYGFDDHPAFHRTAAWAVAGGAGGGLMAEAMMRTVGSVSDPLPLVLAFAAAGALGGISQQRGGWKAAFKGGVLGLFGGVVGAAAFGVSPWVGALFLALAATPVLAKGASSKAWLATAAFATFMLIGGGYVVDVLLNAEILQAFLPGPLPGILAGATAGLFLGLGSAPRHLGPRTEPVEAAFALTLPHSGGEVRQILDRGLELYRAVITALGDAEQDELHQQIAGQVQSLALRIADVAGRVETVPDGVDDRIEALKTKLDACVDPAAKSTLGAAIESLEEQQRAIAAMHHGRERILARLEAHLVLMERVRFSLAHQRSADAERIGGAPTQLEEALEALTRELDSEAQAVGEVYGGALIAEDDPSP